ncbi:ATP-binding protein [Massilia pseudoviolaceinigra]|uniref:ATP-binding protein n=1 Tax=Massilia pseudoviolaceinigra TaxID=3057165 RepID=UPI0027966ABB|nr:ATP-binding protein [Massilia sp. CCM 9206]MDQ1922975.1 ATP-binding protein [Massilia sp. CCM 9206]
MSLRILKIAIGTELDVVGARQRAREIAVLCGFAMQDQVRIATSVSELARNVFNYAHGGKVEFSIEDADGVQVLQIRIDDQGPGIADLDLVLSGRYQSSTGMGLGILGARRLMDRCDISTARASGTQIVLQKRLSSDAPRMTARMVGDMCAHLNAQAPDSMLGEVQQQNQELLGTLDELKARQEELLQLTRELEENNRAVKVLYAELDEKADHLRHADQMKSRFLSNMSHEFRTPLSSIRALAKLLLARADGELSGEQEKQVSYILQGTVAMNEMVDDLLDLAKIEAGKVDVRPERFLVADMFSTLRGLLRPLLHSPNLALTFQEPEAALALHSDQGKLSQILRNFISNAIKYTERGDITVRAALLPEQGMMHFSVSDTGLGIAESDQALIFEEFSQIENRLQTRVKGTGLGLPLCRNLAGLLGGSVGVDSVPGAGSVFWVSIPLTYTAEGGNAAVPPYSY